MNRSVNAHRELARTLNDVHQELAVSALQGIGADIDNWSDAMCRKEEMQTLIQNYKDQIINSTLSTEEDKIVDHWGLGTVLYDPVADKDKPYYPVPVLGTDKVQLVLSSSPVESVFARSNASLDDLDYPSFPVKYLLLKFSDKKGIEQNGFVVVSGDMPPTAVHGEDVKYVDSRSGENIYIKDLHEVLSAVEKAFGAEALETLSDEACIALGGAIRASRSELRGYSNTQYWPGIYF